MPKSQSLPVKSSRTADKFVVRLPDGMREKIADIAKDNHRSMNSEIIDRLTLSIAQDEEGDLTVRTLAQVTRRCEELEQQLAELKANQGTETPKPGLQLPPRLSIASAQ
ncbi:MULTISPECIES: Arc family DNA-binding protein [Pseudomonas]|jgi:BMFP domain-containing protein YqiC|uniref:Arc family DNA-binding protein n=1 Tax=Pseudomonas TaxID=286 RepID=UPI0015E416E7|nr:MULTISPECIES: Arc family DNA-binding protein [Pseudomonas]MBA1204749.1 Arc family DNA-binding protein [Pseudomonas capeferrum]